MDVTERSNGHPEEALDRAIRGHASPLDAAALDEHLSTCGACAAQLAIATSLEARVCAGPRDEALNRAAVHRALAQLALGASPARRPWRGLGARLLAGGAALTVAAALMLWRADHRPPTSPELSSAPAPLVLEDGSEIVPSDGIAVVQVAEKTPTRTLVRLRAGGARFRIRHDARRLFQVDAGAVEIEDLGTDFRVLHERGGQVRVSVSEGRVAVIHGPSRLRVELGAGEERTFSPATAPPPAPPPAVAASRLAIAAPVSADDLPRTGRHPSPGDRAADLLAAADLARRSGRPEAAVAPLRRLVQHDPADPRAPSAAFTLGWVLLMDLGRPREAALAFEQAERMAPRSALSEDATARAAQAWQKAGISGRAGEAAHRYARLYPTGRYAAMMRGLTGER